MPSASGCLRKAWRVWRVDFRRCQAADVGEVDFHPFHRQHFEARFLKIAGEHIVDAADEISHADELLHAQRAQRLDLGLRRGDDGNFELVFPLFGDLRFALEALDHERRRAFGMNQIDAFLGKLGDFLVNSVERGAEFVFGAALEIQINRHDADAFGH